MASFSRDLNSASVSDPSSGDELQELRDTTAESTKLSDLTEDISEDDHDPGNDNDLTISEISELNNAEMDIIIDILDLEIDQEYVLVKRDNLQKLVDAAAEPTKLSDLTEVISEDDHDPEDNNDLAISEISELDDAEVDMIFDSTEGTTKYDGEVFDSNEDDFLVEEYRCSTPELETRVRQLKREARALKWH
ncbi:hypothetical protein EYC80_005561 [Monilinia laxa]|uniref:Uncharacterized protein n=1 Tax=Monilinia laxa TaxID=61186 RepID=A0A5N6KE95_MONLA|nr:hypothetical protein EYC80_005561 [Monilinia laxa]